MSGISGNIDSGVYTAKGYLSGCVNFPVPDEAAEHILMNRGVDSDAESSDLDTETKELLKADLYVWFCMGPSRVGAVSDSDNGWSHSDGGYTLSESDKERMLDYANAIYEKYDEESPVDDSVTVDISSYGVMHCDFDGSGNPLPHTVGF